MNDDRLQRLIERRAALERQCAENWHEWSRLSEPRQLIDPEATAARDRLRALIGGQQREIEFVSEQIHNEEATR